MKTNHLNNIGSILGAIASAICGTYLLSNTIPTTDKISTVYVAILSGISIIYFFERTNLNLLQLFFPKEQINPFWQQKAMANIVLAIALATLAGIIGSLGYIADMLPAGNSRNFNAAAIITAATGFLQFIRALRILIEKDHQDGYPLLPPLFKK